MQKQLPLIKNLLTIAIPCYNGAANFAELFNSIALLGLNAKDYEILVIDNASCDGTEAVITDFKQQIPNLKYHKNESNIGRIENWNLALDLCEGEFLILMNVNDRFLAFDIQVPMQVLKANRKVTMVLTDYTQKGLAYPNWLENGYFKLPDYIKATFLDERILEFYSLGILHQHIFRTDLIRSAGIYFDPKMPRTTDRVFVGKVAAAGGNLIYYHNQSMVEWRLNKNRYHFAAHINKQSFNLEELWLNEYEANFYLCQLAGINQKDFLRSQLILASRYIHKNRLYNFRNKLYTRKEAREGLEFITARIYLEYVKAICAMNKIKFNYFSLKVKAFVAVSREFLIFHNVFKKNRSLKTVIRPTAI